MPINMRIAAFLNCPLAAKPIERKPQYKLPNVTMFGIVLIKRTRDHHTPNFTKSLF
jgi:hypothetical protein